MNKLLALADSVEKMNRLLEIAVQVEGLTEPDDDVFREAFDACYPKPERVWEDEDRERWSTEYENHHNLSWRYESFLEVGAYQDAAMLLVPEGWHLALYSPGQADGEQWHATLAQRLPTVGWLSEIGVGAETASLAVVTCALRARAHGGGE